MMTLEKDPQENDVCLEEEKNGKGGRRGMRRGGRMLGAVGDRLNSLGISVNVAILLCILIFLLFVLLIIVIIMVATPCAEPKSSPRPLCDTPSCLRASAAVLEKANVSVDPCVDFYEYACGSWLREHPILAQKGKASVVGDSRFEFSRRSREIIETLPYTADFRSLNWKIKSFYHSCMDVDSVDSAGDASLKRHIDQLKGWKPIGTWLMNSWDWGKVLRDLHSLYGVFPFFRISVVPDEVNPIQNVIQISPSGLGLPHYSYYFRTPDDRVVQAYRQLMKDLAQLQGATLQRAIDFADEVYHFEKRIAENILNREEGAGENRNVKMTVKELREISQRINWIDHLKSFLPQTYISENTPVYTTSKKYLVDVSTILSTTDMGSLNSYLIWTLVFKYAPSLSNSYRNAIDTYKRVYTGATQPPYRWEFCIETTNNVFSLALTSLYVRSDVRVESFYLATDLYRNVRSSFLDSLHRVDWMDSSIQNLAFDKIKNIHPKVTRRDFVLDDSALNTFYDKLSVMKTDFFQNVQNGALFHRSQLENAFQTKSREYLEVDALVTYDVYHRNLNQIVLSPFLIQNDLFDKSLPRYLLLGSIGSQFGHGLIQGFEEVGKMFDRTGFKPYFWSNRTMVEFARHRECVANKYADQFQIDGNRTVDSNIADIGGVTQAYRAFVDWEEREGLESMLPQMSLTPEQLFFVSYAQTMCSEARLEQLENDMQLSKHPPEKIRVLGTLSEIPEFANSFHCHKGTTLNPYSRCKFF